MTLEINPIPRIVGRYPHPIVKSLQSFNGFAGRITFTGARPNSDVFKSSKNVTNLVLTPELVDKMINTRRVHAIFDEFNASHAKFKKLEYKTNINEQMLDDLRNGHLSDTEQTVLGIVSKLPWYERLKLNLQILLPSAKYHDLGKLVIPEEIVNKAGALDVKEREIMDLHSRLSEAMLMYVQGMNKDVLNLVRNHHQNALKIGYPKVNNGFKFGLEAQILSMSDIYSALRAERPYKTAMSKAEALEIIMKEHVQTGKLSSVVYQALIKYVNAEEKSAVYSQRKVFNFEFINGLGSIFPKINKTAA